MMSEQQAKEWIERFLNGETTNAEEQELYRFFSGENIPRALRKYKPMFDWYAGGMQGELPEQPRLVVLKSWWKKVAVAASIIAAGGIGIGFYHYMEQKKYDFLEGSYIIRDGKKITNIKSILPELREMNKMAMQLEKEVNELVDFDVDKYIYEVETNQYTTDENNIPII